VVMHRPHRRWADQNDLGAAVSSLEVAEVSAGSYRSDDEVVR